jgi:hypothetical protein
MTEITLKWIGSRETSVIKYRSIMGWLHRNEVYYIIKERETYYYFPRVIAISEEDAIMFRLAFEL